METTIKVLKIYRKEGTDKYNNPYLLTKLMDSGKNYYNTFDKKITSEIEEGMTVTLEYENGTKPNFFNITKIIAFGKEAITKSNANPVHTPIKNDERGRASPDDSVFNSPEKNTPSPLSDAEIGTIFMEAGNRFADPLLQSRFIDALLMQKHQRFSLAMSKIIQANDKEKMRRYGKV